MARSSECTEQYAQKVFDSADIVRDEILRRQPDSFRFATTWDSGNPVARHGRETPSAAVKTGPDSCRARIVDLRAGASHHLGRWADSCR